MAQIKFVRHSVPSRKDLLHIVEENGCSKVYEDLPKNFDRWIEELHILNSFISKYSIGSMDSIYPPPIGSVNFKQLGENIFIYRGSKTRLRGIWVKSKIDPEIAEMFNRDEEVWKIYNLESNARLMINGDLRIESSLLLPDNFETNAEIIQDIGGCTQRKISKFNVEIDNKKTSIYAKTSSFLMSFFSSKPSYRLTNIAHLHKYNSEDEINKYIRFANIGIKVPRIIGFYNSLPEDILFVEEQKGNQPDEYFKKHRSTIINQDAIMLGLLFMAGYKKSGFCDFDDKIFDGKKLSLIDVDECCSLYSPFEPDFKEILINPCSEIKLIEFRKMQREVFLNGLKDVLFNYQDSLLPTPKLNKQYISSFFNVLNWGTPSKEEIINLTTFGKNYITLDQHLAMCNDN
jgi:hypothetical protein